MKQFLISLSILCSLASFSQSQNVTPPDTRTVTGCGWSTEGGAQSNMLLMGAPNQDEEVTSANVYHNGSNWCWSVTFTCTGINSKERKVEKQKEVSNPAH